MPTISLDDYYDMEEEALRHAGGGGGGSKPKNRPKNSETTRRIRQENINNAQKNRVEQAYTNVQSVWTELKNRTLGSKQEQVKNDYIDWINLSLAEGLYLDADHDLELEAYRSSSKGGQNANKVSSAVRLRHKISGLYTESQEQRDQLANRETALKKLEQKLQAHIDQWRIVLTGGNPNKPVQELTEHMLENE